MHTRARHRSLVALAAAVLGALASISGCVSGTTPDCSDAAAGCSPDLDATVSDGAVEGGDVSNPTDAPNDRTGDAPADSSDANAADSEQDGDLTDG